MDKTVYHIVVFFAGELISLIIFYFITRAFSKKITRGAVVRGWLERAFLFIALINSLPQTLILFGALKIGTRLRKDEDQVSNDYFLTGSIISALMAIIYYSISIKVLNI